ncbi:MAG: CRISPR-associated endoribonuclease Cas6 [Chitinophagales bacterium]|nr:CRISPR-associated endoribonuclease Cas6 [Chitinophagales bacterium]
MRIRLSFQVPPQSVLPVNYQYAVSAWIYKCLFHGDPAFSQWLHEQGYSYQGKRFKLFTFSQLKCSFTMEGDRMALNAPNAELLISFLIDEQVAHFVTGCFRNQECMIGDRVSHVSFTIAAIEVLPAPAFSDTMRYRLLSPLCITRSRIHEGGEGYEFLSPDHVYYKNFLVQNLIHKHHSVYAVAGSSEDFLPEQCTLKVLSSPRSRLIRIKDHTEAATNIRGWMFDFELKAPVELQRVGYYAGFGEKNAMGMGLGEVK